MKLVEALVTYKEKGIKDKELNRIPEPGEQFEVTEERLEVLLGNNSYNKAFVKLVEEKDNDEIVSEEEVQAVAEAIVVQAQEDNKTIEEVVNEIVEESKEETENVEVTEDVESKKKKSKRNSK